MGTKGSERVKKTMHSGHASDCLWFWLKITLCCFLFAETTVSQTSETETCGESPNPNSNFIDHSEPENPGPFYDLTTKELKQLQLFLAQDPKIKAVKPETATMGSSFIHTVDLYVAGKSDILKHIDNGGPAPARRARVLMFRGDKTPPLVEDYVCGPLPNVTSCELLNLSYRRNPVEFSLRPLSLFEYAAVDDVVLPKVDKKVGHILRESYGATYTNCQVGVDCLTYTPSPVGSGITKTPEKRITWFNAQYGMPGFSLHSLDFMILVDGTSPNPDEWPILKVYYSGQVFNDLDELIDKYERGTINKTKVTPPVNNQNLYSNFELRGEPSPPNPQRPPTLVEPDGKRYSLKNREVKYLGWTFNFRSSSFTGPAVYDVRFKGERIAFEIALSEIATIYSGHNPFAQTTNYVDSGGESYGPASRSLVPGADCPETATVIPNVYISQTSSDLDHVDAGFCLFENNNGYPLRRQLNYNVTYGSFYGSLLDSALVLRSIVVIGRYNYVVDFSFHQNGVIALHFMSTGYMQSVFYTELEKPFGFHIQDYTLGHIHNHFAIFKVDLDIGGTSNRYETLDMHTKKVNLTAFPEIQFSPVRFKANLKKRETEAVLDYNFDKPKYHVVHNEAKKTNYNQLKGYRIQMNGNVKSLIAPDQFNEPTFAWVRHQMVVTKQKDEELSASTIFGLHDGGKPVLNFTDYYADNDGIVDEDLVFWITEGMYHIPHTEDLPVTPTVGNQLSIYLLPYNYFLDCPSMGSRDAIYVSHKDKNKPELGLKVERYGNTRDQCLIPKSTLEEDVERDPDRVLAV